MPRRLTPGPVLAALLLVPALAGCLGGTPPADVLATFYPMEYLARGIAGDGVTVERLVPAGQEPHDWEASPADVARLGDARLVVAQSLGFEPWLPPLVASLGRDAPRVVYTGAALDAADGDDGENGTDDEASGDHDEDRHDHAGDPHTWLDPVLYRLQLHAALAGFLATYPEDQGGLVIRAALVGERIDHVHQEYQERLDDCRTRTFVSLHAAFGLLAHRYGLEMHSVMGLSPEAEPSAATIDRIIHVVRENNLTVVFTEPGSDRDVMQTIAAETGAVVRTLDPVEVAAGGDWAFRMRGNLEALGEAMGCPR